MIERATLTAADVPQPGPGWRQITVACPHGQTTAAYPLRPAPGEPQLTEPLVVHVALIKHATLEGCDCTAALCRRYGVGA